MKPVAWMYKEDWDEIDFTLKHYKIVEVNTRRCFNDDIPLYTASQTKPLSDEEIKELSELTSDPDPTDFVRAIEERHGIK